MHYSNLKATIQGSHYRGLTTPQRRERGRRNQGGEEQNRSCVTIIMQERHGKIGRLITSTLSVISIGTCDESWLCILAREGRPATCRTALMAFAVVAVICIRNVRVRSWSAGCRLGADVVMNISSKDRMR